MSRGREKKKIDMFVSSKLRSTTSVKILASRRNKKRSGVIFHRDRLSNNFKIARIIGYRFPRGILSYEIRIREVGVTWLTTTTFILRICRITGSSKRILQMIKLSPSQIEFKTVVLLLLLSANQSKRRRIKISRNSERLLHRFINDISNIISDIKYLLIPNLSRAKILTNPIPLVRDIGWIKTTKNSPDVGLIRPTIFPRGINSFEWKRGGGFARRRDQTVEASSKGRGLIGFFP